MEVDEVEGFGDAAGAPQHCSSPVFFPALSRTRCTHRRSRLQPSASPPRRRRHRLSVAWQQQQQRLEQSSSSSSSSSGGGGDDDDDIEGDSSSGSGSDLRAERLEA